MQDRNSNSEPGSDASLQQRSKLEAGTPESRANGAAAKSSEQDSLELPLLVLPGTHPCQSCGACCRYIATEIDAPTSMQDYEHIFWYLAHRDVGVYIDWEGDWFLEFNTVCEYLTEAATCGIYLDRPRICSDFSWNECEKTTQEPAYSKHFARPDEFVAWLEEKRPKAFAKYQKFRRKLIEKRAAASPKSLPTGAAARTEAGGAADA